MFVFRGCNYFKAAKSGVRVIISVIFFFSKQYSLRLTFSLSASYAGTD